MRFLRWLFILVVTWCIISNSFAVLALNCGLDTESLSAEEIAQIAERREFQKFTEYAPLPAKCFDVSDDHMIIVGAVSGNNAIIVVYDADGNFQYGFKTEEPGSFRVMWNENSIAYYSLRGERIYIINMDGKITDIKHVVSSKDNSIYDRDVLMSTTRTVDDYTYRMTNDRVFADGFATSFKRITRTSAEGTKVVYDASRLKKASAVRWFIIFIALSAFLSICAVVSIKKHTKAIVAKRRDVTQD